MFYPIYPHVVGYFPINQYIYIYIYDYIYYFVFYSVLMHSINPYQAIAIFQAFSELQKARDVQRRLEEELLAAHGKIQDLEATIRSKIGPCIVGMVVVMAIEKSMKHI